jgi:UDP-glucose:(glucosyl)LPS alpha-1,2-glucosyltransferase
MESNEFSRNAHGGTELMLRRLHDTLDPALLAQFQIIPSRIREIDPDRKTILWLHDVPNEETKPLVDADYRKQFAKIVMVSDWQMQIFNIFTGLPFSECEVILNGIEPIALLPKPDSDECIHIIYHTTPQRGLNILLAAFERLAATMRNLHLHVYSSFSAYGNPERDEPFLPLFEWCRQHPNVTYYGFQPNDMVRRALQTSHIFAYPSVWPETSCISAIEAMSAGNLVVAPNYGGLIDTCNRWAFDYQWAENENDHLTNFTAALTEAIIACRNQKARIAEHIAAQKAFTDRFYNWSSLAPKWDRLLRRLAAR